MGLLLYRHKIANLWFVYSRLVGKGLQQIALSRLEESPGL